MLKRFPYSIQIWEGSTHLPPIHEYFQALFLTTVFKVKIELQEKTEGVLKIAGSLGERLDHFRLRFDPKSPNYGIKKYTK